MKIEMNVETNQGGIYNILKVIVIRRFADDNNKTSFTTEDMMKLTGLSKQATSRSLNNLISIGFLKRTDTTNPDHCNYRKVIYEINGEEVMNFVRNVLYN